MSFPNPAERASWFSNQYERDTPDALYGTGHRPAAALTGNTWTTTCACPDTHCRRADDNWQYPDRDTALQAAAHNLTHNEHGPAAGQENHT